MLCRDDSVRVRDGNPCTDTLWDRILAEFHQLKVSEVIGKGLKFSGCLLWIVKARAKDKTYIWISVRRKTKTKVEESTRLA